MNVELITDRSLSTVTFVLVYGITATHRTRTATVLMRNQAADDVTSTQSCDVSHVRSNCQRKSTLLCQPKTTRVIKSSGAKFMLQFTGCFCAKL